MSEFSESYHIKNGTLEDSIKLIQASAQPGYAGKLNEGWSVLVPESAICSGDPDAKIIGNNQGILLLYTRAEDHGFWFKLFNKDKLVSEYFLNFEDEGPKADISKLNASEFITLTGIAFSAAELEEFLKLNDWEECFKLAYKFMNLLGIEPKSYDWISYHYCQSREKDDPEFGFVKV